jgi:hypothetical protein
MLNLALIFLASLFVIVGLYFIIHRFFPSFGTLAANAIVGLAALLDLAGGLPWDTVLEPKQSAMVLFAITVGNMLMRLNGPKLAVGASL